MAAQIPGNSAIFRLFSLTSKKYPMLRITGSLWGKSSCDEWIFPKIAHNAKGVSIYE